MIDFRLRTRAAVCAALTTLCLTAIISTGAVAQPSGSAPTTTPVSAQPSQDEVLNAIGDATDLARTMPDAFGGLWLDESDVTFAFTHRATDEQIAEVLALIEEWVPLTVVRVDWSEAELQATLEALDEAFDQEPPFLSGAGVDIRNNAVEVAIRPRYFAVCQAGLRARYGPVRLLFVSSEPDRGVPEPTHTPDAMPSPTPFPFALPEACTLPEGASPVPSVLAPTTAPGSPAASEEP